MSISSLLLAITGHEIKIKRKQSLDTFENWLKYNRKSLIKKYVSEFNEEQQRKNKNKKTFDMKIAELVNNHLFKNISFGKFELKNPQNIIFNIDNKEILNKNIMVLNVLNRLKSVKDLDFNNYIIKNYIDDVFSRKHESETIKILKSHTFKVEMERALNKKVELNNKNNKKVKI